MMHICLHLRKKLLAVTKHAMECTILTTIPCAAWITQQVLTDEHMFAAKS
jgi:hypothetical protein